MRCEVARRLREAEGLSGRSEAGVDSGSGEVVKGPTGSLDDRPGVGRKASVISGKTKNRRSRESYNSYQKEYMRKWRARRVT